MKFKKKEYRLGDTTIVWDMPKCLHAEKCWRQLPEVFRREERPWIYPEGASEQKIRAQLDRCPSGALSYIRHEQETNTNKEEENMKITITKGGPALLNGTCTITHADGSVETKEGNMALCRCGASSNKPYCDGSHKASGFEG